jgi:hypothetical protein
VTVLVLRVGGVALALSLLLPWFSGTDDGEPLTVAGWDTEPGFTIAMIAIGLGVAAMAGSRRLRWAPLALAIVAVGLTVWMLGRGDRFSAPDLLAGAYVALAIELALVIAGTLVAFAPRAP